MEPQTETGVGGGCGAFLEGDGVCRWRVWAPHTKRVDLVLYDAQKNRRTQPMMVEPRGFFTATASGIEEGQRYAYALYGARELADPASRLQPDGVHQASAVWDPSKYAWQDSGWQGIPRERMVIYELHVGTFTSEGTFAAIVPRLKELRELGITAIELLPVAQFPGRRNWGYDGTYWYAVQNSYGGPRELQKLVDACHAEGIAVIQDVVYNHLGPEGNYLAEFGWYFTNRYHTPWGKAINYDDRHCEPVRDFVLQNVRMWFRDFHMDGLRLDAAQCIFDIGPQHLLADLQLVAEEEAAKFGREPYIVAESDMNNVKLMQPPETGGYGLDAQWSDDFHHALHALLTGERTGYYEDYSDPVPQLVKAWNSAFIYDGIYSEYRDRRQGASTRGMPGHHFVICTQNHDQVGNRAIGNRLTTMLSGPQLRFAAALMLLAPQTPMLFMGEEYGEQAPFPFFCDFGDPHLREAVRKGRLAEFSDLEWKGVIPDAQAESTFMGARLSWSWPEGSSQAGLRRLYQELLEIRRRFPADKQRARVEAEVLTLDGSRIIQAVRRDASNQAAVLEVWFNPTGQTVTLPGPHPTAQLLLSSEEVKYGGGVNPCAVRNELAAYECLVYQLSSKENR